MAKNKFDNNESAVFYKPNFLGAVDLCLQEAGYESCDPCHAWGPGKKSGYCVHYVLQGKGKVVVNNQEYEVHKGQIFYCGQSSVYYEADKDDPWEYIWVIFVGALAKHFLADTLLSEENPVIDDKDGTLKTNFLQILNASENNEKNYLFTTSYLYLLLGNITKMYPQENKENQYFRSIIDQSIQYIVSNITLKITVENLAKHVALCRSHLYRVFVAEVGYSPKEYITIVKAIYAAELIKKGTCSASSAATEVGYTDYNSFSKFFKRVIGVVPTEFMQLCREGKYVQSGTYNDFLHILEKN